MFKALAGALQSAISYQLSAYENKKHTCKLKADS
jgi:hypothetical protein